ncbi:MAG: hypothetical protein GY754_12655 [bacterium]|nr:hypothetical protein [bacterium]
MYEIDDYEIFHWKCLSCSHQFSFCWNTMDMKHNFDRFFKCCECDRLYYIDCHENKDIVDSIFAAANDEAKRGLELEKHLPPCDCGGAIKFYDKNCPNCGEQDFQNKFETIELIKASREISRVHLI